MAAWLGNPNWLFLGHPGFGYSFLGAAVTATLTVAVVAGGYPAPAEKKPGGLVLGAVSLVLVGLIVGLGHDAALRARFAVDRQALDSALTPPPGRRRVVPAGDGDEPAGRAGHG